MGDQAAITVALVVPTCESGKREETMELTLSHFSGGVKVKSAEMDVGGFPSMGKALMTRCTGDWIRSEFEDINNFSEHWYVLEERHTEYLWKRNQGKGL